MTRTTLKGLLVGLGLAMAASAAPSVAAAQCCAPPEPPPVCCEPPTPPCCTPPPPPPSPPSTPCCTPTTPNVNVNVSNVNIAVAGAAAGARAGAGAGAGATVYYGGGGYGGGYSPPISTGVVQLNVDARRMKKVAYEASRMRTRKVVIQAVCVDARQIPHPASQVRPDREIDAAYAGELYRCIAGTRLQATIADFDGKIDFSGGKTLACGKDDALYHGPGGKVECRRQAPARDCNERSLLRRFGAGVKILTLTEVERYTAYREEEERSGEAVATSMSLDGGVGGYVY